MMLILVITEAVIGIVAICIAWHYAAEVEHLTGEHAGPAEDAVPGHPRYGPLLDTPPGGIEVTRDGGRITVRADLPVQRVRAVADPFTGPMPKLTDEAYEEIRAERPASWAQPPPSIEELRDEYFRYMNPEPAEPAYAPPFSCCRHCDVSPCETPDRHHVACIDCQPAPAFGVDRCEAEVLAAEAGAQMARQP